MQAATAYASADASPPAGGLPSDRQATFTRHALRNVRILSYSYLIDGLVLSLFALAGTVPWMPVVAYTVMGLLIGTFWTVVFQKGWTLGAKDPHMPMTMSLTHLVLQLAGMALMPKLSFMFLLILFIVFTSLAMRVAPRQAVTACAAICVGAGLVLAEGGTPVRIPDTNIVEQVLSWTFVTLILWQCIWIGLFNGAMTATLKRRSRELAALTRKVQHLAHHDELTGLLNRRSLLAILASEQQHADRTGQALTVALFDLDHFKAINDTLGHPAGDRTLKRFATTVQQLARTTDRFGRYGGEEFLLVLAGTPRDDARVPVERFREALRARGWDDVAHDLQVTFSCGLAGHRPGESTEDLLRRADDALYRAKHDGRDCTRAG